jgi:hypothetical protein
MGSGQASIPEIADTLDMLPRPLSNDRGGIPPLMRDWHPLIALDGTLLLNINIKPLFL